MCMLVLQVIVPLKIGSSLYLVLPAFDIAVLAFVWYLLILILLNYALEG